jgi:hypothetical protein
MVLDKETRINQLAREICTLQNKCDDCAKHECMTKDIVEHIYRELIKEATWEITERGCVITCSNCKERVELYWPDGTEVGPSLYYCPYCGAKMTSKITK